jgi:hypothetical protein
MIYYIQNKNIDRIKWDALIDRAINKNYYAYSWYLDLVCKGWNAWVEDDYVSIMPVAKGRRFFINYIYQPMFSQQLGVFSEKEIQSVTVEKFVELALGKYWYLDMNLNYHNVFLFKNFHNREMLNYELNLNNSYEELKKKYTENTRRNIKKTLNNRFVLEKNSDVTTTIQMFRESKGHLYKTIKQKHYDILKHLMEVFLQKKMAEVWYVKDQNGEIMVGAFFLIFKDRIIFLFSGRKDKAKDNKAMFFLFDRMIYEYSDREMILDFEGSNDPGVARFYKSFGSDEKKYLQIKKNRLPFFIKWLKK